MYDAGAEERSEGGEEIILRPFAPSLLRPFPATISHMELLAVLAAQFLYTLSDTWKKVIFAERGFSVQTLTRPVFLATLVIALIGFLFQMYALSKIELSRTIVLMGTLAVVFSTVAGVLYLKEHLNAWNAVGIVLALAAIVLVNVK